MKFVSVLLSCIFLLGSLPHSALADVTSDSGANQDNDKDTTMVTKNDPLDAHKIASDLLNHFPDGTDMSDSQFAGQLDSTTVSELSNLGVTRITNLNGHFSVTLKKPTVYKTKKADIKLAAAVDFDYVRNGDKMTFTNVTGIEVKVNFLLGWMKVLSADIDKDATTGDTIVVGQVHFWGGTVTHRAVIKPDGKVDVNSGK